MKSQSRIVRFMLAAGFALMTVMGAVAQTMPAGYPSNYEDLITAAGSEGHVTVYTSTDALQGGALLKAFRAKYPAIEVDYNDLGTNGAYSRAVSEAAANQIAMDIMWTSAMDQAMNLVEKGYAEAYQSPEIPNIPNWGVFESSLFATSIEPVGILYNKKLVPEAMVPKTRAELLAFLRSDAARYGKICSYDPEKSGIGLLMITSDLHNSNDTWDLIKVFGAAGGKVYGSAGLIKEKIVSGEHVLAWNVSIPYAVEWAKTDPNLGMATTSDYTLAFSRVAFISRGAPHPNAAKLFLDFMLSRDGQTAMGEVGLPSIRSDVERGAYFAEISKPSGHMMPLAVDRTLTQYLEPTRRARFFTEWKKAMRGN